MPHEKICIWTDTHISPAIAKWLNEQFNVETISFYKLDFHRESDYNIFMKAKEQNVIFITKDKDYINLLATFKAPPYIILLRTGNLSNAELKKLFLRSLQKCLDLILKHNYHIVELT
jgi:predicted nuclease of predicted toxin-antitoxin system